MPDESATTGWQRTYRATVTVSPVSHLGSYDDCSAWCRAMLGQEVWVTDADGKPHVIGVITRTESDNASGY